jgi:nucleoside-diphosphate-sugar epimerase
VTVRPFMVYDENEDLGDHRSAMVRFAQRLSEGRPIDVHLGTSRSWLHISDAVVALGRLTGLSGYHVINIGHPKPIETEVLAELVRSCLGASSDLLRFVPQPEQMTPVKIPSLRKQEVLLGVTPKVSIDDGVARVCKRFRT